MKIECQKVVKDKRITFSEKKSKLTLKNSRQVEATKIKVDGCVITTGIRCDYLCIANGIEHYIELKGQDIDHAVKQIEASITQLSPNIKLGQKISYIICTRSPLVSASIQNIQLKFYKNYHSKLIIRSSPFEYAI